MKNINLDFIEECIKVGFLNKAYDDLLMLFNNENLNENEIIRLCDFHAVYPTVHNALCIANLKNGSLFEKVERVAKNQTVGNLMAAKEQSELLKLFSEHHIKVLPYKGLFFLEKLYQGKSLRENGDIDLLFHPDDAKKAIELLQKEGYKLFHFSQKNQTISIDEMLNIDGQIEITMRKKLLDLDVHWGLSYGFLPYKVSYLDFFKNTEVDVFLNQKVVCPNAETIFWMIVLHHGGKDLWLRYKSLLDLMAFMNTHSDKLDWTVILDKAKDYKIFRIMLLGFKLLETKFQFSLPAAIVKALNQENYNGIEAIYNYWAIGRKWNKPLFRLRYERILCRFQDKGFSKWQYYKAFAKQYSKPNSVEYDRYITFPEKYHRLNFISKVISYLIQRIFVWK